MTGMPTSPRVGQEGERYRPYGMLNSNRFVVMAMDVRPASCLLNRDGRDSDIEMFNRRKSWSKIPRPVVSSMVKRRLMQNS